MPVISGIVPATRPSGRFSVLVDGRETAVLTLEAIERLRLAVGRPVAGLEEQIAMEAQRLQAYDRALNMLAFRGRSSSELARSLQRKGEDKAHVAWAIDRLREQGLLDDAAFARSFARAKVVDHAADFAIHGFQTVVVSEPLFSTMMRRSMAGSSTTQAPAVLT